MMVFLAPGAVQARTLDWSWDGTGEIGAKAFFSKVWNLLVFWRDNSGPAVTAKHGGTADPAGQPPPPSSSSSCDNGGTADPAGDPCTG
jgi:hypothetical protein